jgi:hypothetical protein
VAIAQRYPARITGTSFKRDHWSDSFACFFEAMLVVEHLTKGESDLTGLVATRQTLYFDDGDSILIAPREIEVRIAWARR